MQVSVTALVTFEIENPPKGPHGKAAIERRLIEMVSGKVIDQSKPIVIESDMGNHPVALVEIFAHAVNEAPGPRHYRKTGPTEPGY